MARSGLIVAVGALLLSLLAGVLVVLVVLEDSCLPDVGLTEVDLPAKPAPVRQPAAPLTARVASWNTLYSNSTSRVNAGLRTIARSADVIGVQELWGGKRGPTERSMAKIGWGVSDGNNAVRIFYDARKYRLLAEGSEKVLGVVRIEAGTAGRSIGPKSVQWVQLQDRRTGGVFFTVNHHIVPDIDRRGHPRKGAPKRLSVYETQMAGMLSLVQKLRPYGPVVIVGDHNVDARADHRVKNPRFPYMVMRSAGILSSWAVVGAPKHGTQTSGRRLIDYVWLTQSTGRFLNHKILGAYGSDHHAVVATIANRAGAAAPPSATPSVSAARAAASVALPTTLNVPGWTLDAEQIRIAATAIEVGRQFNIPERGWIVSISSGLQESGLRNLAGGDRDSVGWQQQRPSTGWGTVKQARDVRLATMAFYGVAPHTSNPGLTDIKGWEQMPITRAAQAVQRSGFPGAYAKHETAARAIVAKLAPLVTGSAPLTEANDLGCSPETTSAGPIGNCPATKLPVEAGLKPDALRVLRCVHQQFPQITDFGGVHPDPLPDHPSGRAVDFMIPRYQSQEGNDLGWVVSRWLKDHRTQLGVRYVIFDSKIWSVERDGEGWRPYSPGYTSVINDSSTHLNHIHVTVFGDAAKPDNPGESIAAGAWHSPVAASYPPGCGFRGAGCQRPYRSHTGQDFPAPTGQPVYAVTTGRVIRSESLLAGGGTCTTLPICGGAKRSYGNLLVIETADGGQVTAWYAHLAERRVRVGETVRTGEVIGTVGYQGNVIPQGPGGAHLHFEVRIKGSPVEPLRYLRNKGIRL